MMKFKPWMIVVVLALVALFFFLRTSGYAPIVTNLGDKVQKELSQLKTDIKCISGAAAPGAADEGSYYQVQDGAGYGICGDQALISSQMQYKILGDLSDEPLGG